MDHRLELNPVPNKDTLIQQVYHELRRALLTGGFQPGQRVTIRQITEIMGVSTTPVREALGRIIQDGGLRYAGPKTIEVPVLSLVQFEELEEVRIVLERTLAPSIIANADRAFLATLKVINDEFAKLRKEGRFKQALEKNMEFHFALYERSRREFTVSLLENVWLVSGPAISMLYPRFAGEASGVAFHIKAIKAIRASDADNLADALVDDLRTGFAKIKSAMKERTLTGVEL